MGSWWQGKNHKDQDEIDIIGLYAEEKPDLFAYSLHIFHTEISHFNFVFRNISTFSLKSFGLKFLRCRFTSATNARLSSA